MIKTTILGLKQEGEHTIVVQYRVFLDGEAINDTSFNVDLKFLQIADAVKLKEHINSTIQAEAENYVRLRYYTKLTQSLIDSVTPDLLNANYETSTAVVKYPISEDVTEDYAVSPDGTKTKV